MSSKKDSGNQNKEESKNPDSQSFKTDSLSLAVKDIEKNLAKEKASTSEKGENGKKERASSMPQTSSTDIGESSSEDGQKEARPSLEMDGRASPLELSTIVEEAEVTEQDMEMSDCDSQQTGQGQPEKESKISGATLGDAAGNQPEPSGLETATGDQAGPSAPEAATGNQAGLSAPEAATGNQAGLSAPEAATGNQAGPSAPEAATGNQAGLSAPEAATGNQAGLSAPEAATGNQAGPSAPEAATGNQAGLSASEAATGNQAGLSAPEAATGNQAGPSAPEAATGNQAGPSAPEAATGNQAGLSAPEAATGNQAGPSAPEAATGNQAGPSAPEAATGNQTRPSALEAARGFQIGLSALEAATGYQIGLTALEEAMGYQAGPSSLEAVMGDDPFLLPADIAAIYQHALQRAEQAAQDQAGFLDSSESEVELQEEEALPTPLDVKRYVIYGTYPFLPNSAMISSNPFNEAIESLCDGNIIHAILCFEAFVKPLSPFEPDMSPSAQKAWLCLGIAQAAIHQDILAIMALKTYLFHEPNNLNALIFLSLSYSYENYKNLTLVTLWEWLFRNPKYSDLIHTSPPDVLEEMNIPFDRTFLRELTHMFKQAFTRVTLTDVDLDLHCGLGLLYNLRKKYRRAALVFRSAVMTSPRDEMLWYHLGESLMNDGKYDEAMDAYNLALHFRPDYVRAHYKMGITYSRVMDYPNALKQYMIALSLLAENSRGLEGTLHEDIMKSIKKVVVDMGRPDLLPAVQGQNLEVLSRACGFQFSNYMGSDSKNNIFRLLKHVFSP